MANPTLVVVWELWEHLRTVLSTPHMLALLGGARVRVAGEDYPDQEGGESEVWARLVVVPTDTLWPTTHVPGKLRKVGFLTRAEMHAPQEMTRTSRPLANRVIPGRTLDAIQLEANRVLQGYTPPVGTMDRVMVGLPIYLRSEPQPVPLWDEPRGLYFTSAEYRTEVAPDPAP